MSRSLRLQMPLAGKGDGRSEENSAKNSGRKPAEGEAAPQPVAVLNPCCMVCGQQNPHGLQLTFFAEANGVVAEWVPGETWESFPGTIHGGAISTVLDEAMSKAIIALGMEAYTAELRVRFKEKIRTGEAVRVRAWVVLTRKRRITAEARLCSSARQERAHAWGTFLISSRASAGSAPGWNPLGRSRV